MKFIKSFFSIIGIHLAMCIVPFLLLPILNTDPKYTVDAPKSAGQIIIYALYFVLFFAVYFWIGRSSGGNVPENRWHKGGIIARGLASAVIVGIGLYVYYGVIVPQNLNDGFWSIFAMPQLMVKRAISDEVIGNKIFSTVIMIMPGILVWTGFASNGFKKSKQGSASV